MLVARRNSGSLVRLGSVLCAVLLAALVWGAASAMAASTAADLAMSVSPSNPSTITEGSAFTAYVRNNGPGIAQPTVTVTLGSGLAYSAGYIDGSVSRQCKQGLSANVVTCTVPRNVYSYSSAVITIVVTPTKIGATSISFTGSAVATSDPNTANNTATAPVNVTQVAAIYTLINSQNSTIQSLNAMIVSLKNDIYSLEHPPVKHRVTVKLGKTPSRPLPLGTVLKRGISSTIRCQVRCTAHRFVYVTWKTAVKLGLRGKKTHNHKPFKLGATKKSFAKGKARSFKIVINHKYRKKLNAAHGYTLYRSLNISATGYKPVNRTSRFKLSETKAKKKAGHGKHHKRRKKK